MNIVDMFKALTLTHKIVVLGISGLVVVCIVMMYRVLRKSGVGEFQEAEDVSTDWWIHGDKNDEPEPFETEVITEPSKEEVIIQVEDIATTPAVEDVLEERMKYSGRRCAVCGKEEGYLYRCEKCGKILCQKHKYRCRKCKKFFCEEHKDREHHKCDPNKLIEGERLDERLIKSKPDKVGTSKPTKETGKLKSYVTEDGVLRNSRHGPLYGERIRKIGKTPRGGISKEEAFRELRDSRREIIEKAKRMFPIEEEKKEEVKHSLTTQEETEHNKYKCQYCGMYENKLYKCRKCGGEFCMEHRLTKNHECLVKKIEKEYRVYIGLKWVFGEPFVEHNLWVKSIK